MRILARFTEHVPQFLESYYLEQISYTGFLHPFLEHVSYIHIHTHTHTLKPVKTIAKLRACHDIHTRRQKYQNIFRRQTQWQKSQNNFWSPVHNRIARKIAHATASQCCSTKCKRNGWTEMSQILANSLCLPLNAQVHTDKSRASVRKGPQNMTPLYTPVMQNDSRNVFLSGR